MNLGLTQLMIPLFGGFVLTDPLVPITHQLDALGEWSTSLPTPNNPAFVGTSVFFQAAYMNPAAPFGLAASDGLEVRIR